LLIILNLISILDLQNIYPFKNFIKKKKIYFEKINNFIFKLYETYNSSLNELGEEVSVFNWIIEIFNSI